MRDKRAVITQKICMVLVQRGVSQEIIDEAKAILETELSKCEVYDRCTSLTVVDNTPYQILNDYLDIKRIEGKSERTIKRYRYEIERLLWYCNKPLDEITSDDIRLFLDYKKRSGKKPLSNRTIENMRICYRPFFAWLTAERIIKWNPCLSVHQVKFRKTIRKVYSPVELQQLREACECARDTALIDWLISTGCRVSEVASARLSMIDWTERSCIVIGKGAKERKVYFDDVTSMHLKAYLATRDDVVDALFLGRAGNPITIGGIQQCVRRIGKRAGVADAYCHRFRHTLATNLVSKMPVIEVASILGHDDISTTQIYCHADPTSVMADYRKAMT